MIGGEYNYKQLYLKKSEFLQGEGLHILEDLKEHTPDIAAVFENILDELELFYPVVKGMDLWLSGDTDKDRFDKAVMIFNHRYTDRTSVQLTQELYEMNEEQKKVEKRARYECDECDTYLGEGVVNAVTLCNNCYRELKHMIMEDI